MLLSNFQESINTKHEVVNETEHNCSCPSSVLHLIHLRNMKEQQFISEHEQKSSEDFQMPPHNPKPIGYVFFDWAGTLAKKGEMEKSDKLRGRLSLMLDKLILLSPTTTPPSLDFFEEKLNESRGTNVCSWPEIMNRVWPKVGLDSLSESDKRALTEAFFSGDESPLYDGTEELLQTLVANKIPVGLIRNSKIPTPIMQRRLDKYGIGKYFNVVVMAGEEGAEKPDALVFHRAIEKAGIQHLHNTHPQRIFFVGNETALDVKGANGVGWTSVLVCHTENSSSNEARHDVVNLKDLHSLITAIMSSNSS